MLYNFRYCVCFALMDVRDFDLICQVGLLEEVLNIMNGRFSDCV